MQDGLQDRLQTVNDGGKPLAPRALERQCPLVYVSGGGGVSRAVEPGLKPEVSFSAAPAQSAAGALPEARVQHLLDGRGRAGEGAQLLVQRDYVAQAAGPHAAVLGPGAAGALLEVKRPRALGDVLAHLQHWFEQRHRLRAVGRVLD